MKEMTTWHRSVSCSVGVHESDPSELILIAYPEDRPSITKSVKKTFYLCLAHHLGTESSPFLWSLFYNIRTTVFPIKMWNNTVYDKGIGGKRFDKGVRTMKVRRGIIV